VNIESRDEKKELTKIRLKWYWMLLALLLLAIMTAPVVIFRHRISGFQRYGYLGAFIICFLASATVVAFIPSVPIIFLMGGVWNPFFIALVAGIGEGIGEFTGYFAGRSGNASFKSRFGRLNTRLEKWVERRGSLALFLSAAVFNPFSSIIGATAGILRFPPWKFFLSVWSGKTVKWTIVTVLGQLILVHLLHWRM
jgi:membrane protein YqaA with SNARE-associated domain